MTRYMPITGIDCTIASLLIDTEAPIDVLHDTAAYRICSVTQLLETLSLGEGLGRDALLLQDFARVLAIPLRDGCDLMDVVGRRLQR
ncbi:phosphate-starvation-inducible protein PsiE [Pseudomonas sp. FW306-02-F02-AA]|uniref:Short-chain dehydrogenase n=1 Tax=Pseudomonas fluorescens TaxID=294 RepID=A0A0N9WJ88_PSEFL|nr:MULTISPECIES: hypothetical protein [Pseudomonas]ALI03325.1 hypothetical protein AO353_20415 [Pseudomonas fluorescens]PMZ00767.1 phosphate-starvation-inducible protein PsiE [Pseudomonas sp. FW306-02-F02-AB]PMZ07335.1 phosphate-starvation-inducible protein PsiE [Pseudomonas sp. FW306-02-H06C]PMZ13053.1 phosphate-starvation-inducible protein PsiE [Pseudomonas sp. FW306-02-F02-AA]PMZ18926.1 phosphate-starvation-inducible protein PsiE [Pseudomonas sp. FW306-02-F08-AA]